MLRYKGFLTWSVCTLDNEMDNRQKQTTTATEINMSAWTIPRITQAVQVLHSGTGKLLQTEVWRCVVRKSTEGTGQLKSPGSGPERRSGPHKEASASSRESQVKEEERQRQAREVKMEGRWRGQPRPYMIRTLCTRSFGFQEHWEAIWKVSGIAHWYREWINEGTQREQQSRRKSVQTAHG